MSQGARNRACPTQLAVANVLAGFALGAAVLAGGPSATAQAAAPAVTESARKAAMFDGTWSKDGTLLRFSSNPPLTPAAKAKFDSLRPQDDPGARCIESGLGRMMLSPGPMQMIALPTHMLIVAEYHHNVRRIWTDLEKHDPDHDPGYYGESIVHWEGDTMVVDTIGFNGQQYLDSWGYPMSAEMRIVERWKLLNPNKLQIEYTLNDPQNYTQSWGNTFTYTKRPSWRLGEYSCTENNRNDPTNPANPKPLTSTDMPAGYQERPGVPGR